MRPDEILICIFSYNMGRSLQNCLTYTTRLCGDFDIALMDDNSNEPRTLHVIEKFRPVLKFVFANRNPKEGKKHGNLYENVQNMCDLAIEKRYKYIFLVQDDMQFVRPLSENILKQYRDIFEADRNIIQVDPRFLRAGNYQTLADIRAYQNKKTTSYADVGIIDLQRLKKSGWRFVEGERANRDGLAALGFRRVVPFTPVIMHVPFPPRYRNGRLKRSPFLWNRGAYGFYEMSSRQMEAMDNRELADYPHFRKFLTTRNMMLSYIAYRLRKDSRIFS